MAKGLDIEDVWLGMSPNILYPKICICTSKQFFPQLHLFTFDTTKKRLTYILYYLSLWLWPKNKINYQSKCENNAWLSIKKTKSKATERKINIIRERVASAAKLLLDYVKTIIINQCSREEKPQVSWNTNSWFSLTFINYRILKFLLSRNLNWMLNTSRLGIFSSQLRLPFMYSMSENSTWTSKSQWSN